MHATLIKRFHKSVEVRMLPDLLLINGSKRRSQ